MGGEGSILIQIGCPCFRTNNHRIASSCPSNPSAPVSRRWATEPLGELINSWPRGVRVPGGFATAMEAFDQFLAHNKLTDSIQAARRP